MRKRTRTAGLLALLCLGFTGCGGGGSATSTASGGAGGGSTSINLRGTAATGAPLAGATVTLVDAQGRTLTTVTAADGTYGFDVTGLTPPFIIRATQGATVYHTVATGTGTANITPLSEVITASYFQSQGTTAANAMANPASIPLPTDGCLDRLATILETNLAALFAAQGIDTEAFDPLTSPFTANHAGFDAVLDQLDQTGATTLQTVSGTVTTTLSLQGLPGGIINSQCQTQDSATGAQTSDDKSIEIGTDDSTLDAIDAAVTGVNALLAQVAQTVNTQGANLTAAHLLPYLSPSFTDNGVDATTFASQLQQELVGVTLEGMEVAYVLDYDDKGSNPDLLVADYIVRRASDDVVYVKHMVFEQQPGGGWLFRGNDEAVETDAIHFEHARVITNTTDSGFQPTATMYLRTPQGLISNVKATDPTGTFFTTTGTPIAPLPQADNTFLGLPLDIFYARSSALAFPSASTLFSVSVDILGLGTQSFPVRARTTTTDTLGGYGLSINAQPIAHALSNLLGQPGSISWTLPTTFTLQDLHASATLRSATSSVEVPLQVAGNQQSAAIPSLPSTIPNAASQSEGVSKVIIRIEALGSKDESVTIYDEYE